MANNNVADTEKLEDNPLFIICKAQFIQDSISGKVGCMDLNSYWLGFCRGISYASDLHSNSISKLQKDFSEIVESKLRSPVN